MNRTSLLRRAIADFERDYVERELEHNHWNRAKTARDLGLTYRALQYKIKRLGLVSPEKQEVSEPI